MNEVVASKVARPRRCASCRPATRRELARLAAAARISHNHRPRTWRTDDGCVHLCRVVNLGPFKHTIDDGLEVRKAAFEALVVLLDACPAVLDMPAVHDALLSGLKVHGRVV